ncbi:Hypothetical protein FKW44_014202, partial [Caligus rogercresseyi]
KPFQDIDKAYKAGRYLRCCGHLNNKDNCSITKFNSSLLLRPNGQDIGQMI